MSRTPGASLLQGNRLPPSSDGRTMAYVMDRFSCLQASWNNKHGTGVCTVYLQRANRSSKLPLKDLPPKLLSSCTPGSDGQKRQIKETEQEFKHIHTLFSLQSLSMFSRHLFFHFYSVLLSFFPILSFFFFFKENPVIFM